MALQCDTMYMYNQYPQGYWRIERIALTSKTQATAYLDLYEDAATAQLGVRYALPGASRTVLFEYDCDSSLSIQAQGYQAAKISPLFGGAIDV